MRPTLAFQSTLPGWGATLATANGEISKAFQSTLPGWGATWIRDTSTTILLISIHAPRMGSDLTVRRLTPRECISIHAPRMGSDQFHELSRLVVSISIHAPRMGSDYCGITCTSRRAYFNPRSPDGERLMDDSMAGLYSPFQSTLPGWGATVQLLVQTIRV